MRVACLVPYALDCVPSQRFRVEQWAPILATRGIAMDFVPLLSAETMEFLYKPGNVHRKALDIVSGCVARARWAARAAPDYDVVVIHREALLLGVDWIERYLSRRVPTVFDFDDAIWMSNVSAANRWAGFLKGFAKIDRIISMVSAVSAGCEYLAKRARQFNDHVVIVPTSIDLEKYGVPRHHEPTDRITIGWTGSVTTARYLEIIVPVLQRLSATLPFRLRIVGAKLEIPGLDVVCEDWTPSREVSLIRTFDVGLKPAVREEWVRGKCPMKDIQYMALGIPPVATRFGTSVESIEHGVSGFLCDTDDDWVAAIDQLRNVAIRARIGVAARRVVEERYSAVVAAAAFERALGEAITVFQSKGATRSRRRGWINT